MLFEELSKIKRSSIMTSIVLVAVGIVMIMCPARYVDSLVSVLGYGMVVFAAVLMLNFISAKKLLINYIKFAGALVLLLIGISVLVFSNIVLIIGIVFGLILISDGILTIINTSLYVRRAQRKGWWILILLSVLMIAGGLAILINPWWNETTELFFVIGVMLLFSSLVSIVRLIIIWPIKDEEEG